MIMTSKRHLYSTPFFVCVAVCITVLIWRGQSSPSTPYSLPSLFLPGDELNFASLSTVLFGEDQNEPRSHLGQGVKSPHMLGAQSMVSSPDIPSGNKTIKDSNVRFLFTVGTEGTGHHFLQELFRASPMMHELAPFLAKIRRLATSLYNRGNDGLFNFPCQTEARNEGSFQKVVRLLRAVRNLAAKAQGKNNDRSQFTVVPINAVIRGSGTGMMSFPNYGGACRALQFPDLSAFYAACDHARVECSHLVIYRDPLAVIQSTTRNRKFSTVNAQIQTIASMLGVIHSQMLIHRHRKFWCWEYGNTSNVGGVAAAIGWNNFADFTRVFRSMFQSPTAANEETVPLHLRVHMQALHSTTALISHACNMHVVKD